MSNLEEAYQEVCKASSPFSRHCPKIYEISAKCRHITELAIKSHEIVTSILAAKPSKLHIYRESIDLIEDLKFKVEAIIPKNTELKVYRGHSLEIDIELTDMLVINTLHTYSRLRDELVAHAGSVKRFIVFPSIYAFAIRGEDGSSPGAVDAILDFLADNLDWSIYYKNKISSGLIIIERKPTTGPDFERIYSMISFDIPDIKWVERVVVGLSRPEKAWTEKEAESLSEKQIRHLNRALKHGMIVGTERNFTEIQVNGRTILSSYVVYHVGYKKRPAGK